MGSLSIGHEDSERRSFLWLAPFAPPRGWRTVPPGGMCLCAFLFLLHEEKVLLGRYAEHPAWEDLAGMAGERIKVNAHGWTIPTSHLKFGEDPRAAVQRIGSEILALDRNIVYSEPFVATFFYEPAIAPGEKHFDVLFLFESSLAAGVEVPKPPWYEALEWFDVHELQHLGYARQHEDVVQVWLERRQK